MKSIQSPATNLPHFNTGGFEEKSRGMKSPWDETFGKKTQAGA